MCCLTPFRSGEAKCRLLRPRRPSTAVDERERPTWKAYRRSFFYIRCGAERRRRQRRDLVSTRGGIAAVMTLTAPTPRAPSTAAEGAWRLFVFSKFRGDFEQRAGLRLFLVSSSWTARRLISWAAGRS